MTINSPPQILQFIMFHREFVEELAPHVAANDTDDGEHAGDLKVFTEAGMDVPPSNDDELPHQT